MMLGPDGGEGLGEDAGYLHVVLLEAPVGENSPGKGTAGISLSKVSCLLELSVGRWWGVAENEAEELGWKQIQ